MTGKEGKKKKKTEFIITRTKNGERHDKEVILAGYGMYFPKNKCDALAEEKKSDR